MPQTFNLTIEDDDGEPQPIEITIDWPLLGEDLGRSALFNKDGTARVLGGAIRAKHLGRRLPRPVPGGSARTPEGWIGLHVDEETRS